LSATASFRLRWRITTNYRWLDLEPQRVLYLLAPFPVIREFAAMLRMLKPGEQWMGLA
jgi:hypothetical protein